MQEGILQINIQNRGLVLDPRTKLVLLITISSFVLGGAGSKDLSFISPSLCVLPFLLLLSSKKYKTATIYAVIYVGMYIAFYLLSPYTNGTAHFLLLGTTGIITRFMPSIMIGYYVVSSTTVSEFVAAMQRIHLSEKLIIPLSVIFRFFPTVADEFSSINSAMRMRGISLGGKNAAKMLEYRFIPLITCSVKIGEELSAAALTRGLGGKVKRTNVCKIGFQIQDLIIIAVCVVPFVLLLFDSLGILGGQG